VVAGSLVAYALDSSTDLDPLRFTCLF